MNSLLFSIEHSALSTLAAVAPETESTDAGGLADPVTWVTSKYFWIALAIIVLVVLALIARNRRRNRPLEVFSNETGRVQVAGSALSELIENAARQIGAVSRPRVDFENRGDKIHLHVRLKLAAGQRLPEFSESLKKHLSATLRDTFGLTNLGEITITVTGFKGNPLAEPLEKVTTIPASRPEESAPSGPGPAKPADSARSASDFFSTQ